MIKNKKYINIGIFNTTFFPLKTKVYAWLDTMTGKKKKRSTPNLKGTKSPTFNLLSNEIP